MGSEMCIRDSLWTPPSRISKRTSGHLQVQNRPLDASASKFKTDLWTPQSRNTNLRTRNVRPTSPQPNSGHLCRRRLRFTRKRFTARTATSSPGPSRNASAWVMRVITNQKAKSTGRGQANTCLRGLQRHLLTSIPATRRTRFLSTNHVAGEPRGPSGPRSASAPRKGHVSEFWKKPVPQPL